MNYMNLLLKSHWCENMIFIICTLYTKRALFVDMPMFNIKYLAMHLVQVHAGAIYKLVYGLAIIHLQKLVDYLPVQTHEPHNNYNMSLIYHTISPFC